MENIIVEEVPATCIFPWAPADNKGYDSTKHYTLMRFYQKKYTTLAYLCCSIIYSNQDHCQGTQYRLRCIWIYHENKLTVRW